MDKTVEGTNIRYWDHEIKGSPYPRVDARDIEIVKKRVKAYDALEGPRVGDYIRPGSPSGVGIIMPGIPYKRITHIWRDLGPGIPDSIQTSLLEGSFYLGDGYVSYSGGLDPGIPANLLKLTKEKKQGGVWFFHHNQQRGHNGVDFVIPFRVYEFMGPLEMLNMR